MELSLVKDFISNVLHLFWSKIIFTGANWS